MKIFINLPVNNLDKTIAFFTKVGFKFNPQFTDQNATCMIISDEIYAMLLVKPFFKGFIKKEICDTTKYAEVIFALSVNSKEEVDQMMRRVLEAGGTEPREAQNHGWMYGRSFEDVDGHLWEIFYMNEKEMPEEMKEKK